MVLRRDPPIELLSVVHCSMEGHAASRGVVLHVCLFASTPAVKRVRAGRWWEKKSMISGLDRKSDELGDVSDEGTTGSEASLLHAHIYLPKRIHVIGEAIGIFTWPGF